MIGTSRSVWGFDPRSIPGCALWLDAADSNTVTGTTSVTAWRDKSANGYVANSFVNSVPNPSWVPNVRNGNGVIQYSAGNGSSIANFVLAQTMSIFKVYYPINQSIGSPFIEQGPNAGSESGFFFHSQNDNNFYIKAGSVGLANFGTTTVSNTWQMIEGINPDPANGNTVAFYVNGITRASGGTQSDTTTVTKTLYINGRAGTSSVSYNTYLAELIIYNIAVTTTQRQQIEGYLAHKWGLTGYYDSSIPLTIPGCQLWLDGADSSTVTGTTSVTQWRDKSGNGRNTTTTGTVSYANSGISITTSSSYLTGSFGSPDYTGTTVSCFIVASMNSASGSVGRLLALGKVGTQDGDNLASIAMGRGGGLVVRTYRTVPTSSPPSIPAYDTRFIATWGQTSSLLFNSINGGALTTASLSGAFAINAYRIGHDLLPDDANEQLNGVINEIVVYFSELTTTQRQTIEGYLSKKWGIGSSSSIPSTHPFSSIRPHLRTFQPIDVPGCQLWLDAADQSSMTLSGSNVTQIRDKSSNAYTFTGSAGTYPTRTATLNGLPVISSATGQYLQTTSFNQNFLTATSFFVIRPTQTVTGSLGYHVVFQGNAIQVMETGLVSDGTSYYTYLNKSGTGLLYSDPIGFNPVNTTLLASCLVTGSASTNQAYINGSLNRTGGENGTFNQLTSQTLNCIGRPTLGFGFEFAEAILYGTVLTTSQRQQVEGYLAHKWGLTPSYSPTTPLSIPGCQLWLDAADSSTITFGTGSSVASWRDKVNGYAVANSSAAYRPVYSQGTIRFTGSTNPSYLDIPTLTIGSSAFSIFFVIQNTGPASGNGSVPIFFWPLSGNGSGALSMTGWLDINVQGVTTNISSTLLKNQYYVISYTFGVTTNFEQLYANGISIGTYQKSSGYSASLYRLGAIDATLLQYLSDGNIGEMLVYNTGLTNTQRQQIEGYLARKWGISISATLPSPHPFKSFPPATLPFSPRNISGCQLWLDGADQSSMTLSGSSVIVWNDKSGNGYHMNTLTPTATWTGSAVYPTIGTSINGLQTVNFVAQSGLKQGTTLDGVKNFFWVGRIAAPIGTGDQSFFLMGHDTNYDWHGFPYGGKFMDDRFAQAGIYNATASLFTSDPNAVTSATFNNMNMPSAPNVSLLSVAGITGTTRYQGICYDRTTNPGWCGDLAEVLIFSTALTTSQRQQVEGYLAQKWGLTTSLPATHPYKKLPA